MNVPGTDPLSLTATRTDERTHLVTVVGDVDLATAARLAEYLDQFEDRNVVVDLSSVWFLDSSGIQALLAAHRRIERRGGVLTIRGATPIVQKVLRVTGLDQVLSLEGHD